MPQIKNKQSGMLMNITDQAAATYGLFDTNLWDPVGFSLPAPQSSQTELANAVTGYGSGSVPMVSLKNKTTGQVVPVSKTDWDTNPSYKNGEWGLESGEDQTGGFDLNSWLENAFQQQSQITPVSMGDLKTQFITDRDSQLAALDAKYAQDVVDLRTRNKNLGSSLKSRLIKLGVSPSDSSWTNAEAGQAQRDAEAETRLRNEYNSQRSAIYTQSSRDIANVAMQENQQAFNAQVENMNNSLQKIGQGISLFQIFSQRDQSEKDREQKAYGDLLQYETSMATLDNTKKQAMAKNFIDNAQRGLYNISDKATLEMLMKLEMENPDYLTGLTEIATNGLSDRLLDITSKELAIQKTKADIAKARSGLAADASKEEKAFYDDIEEMVDRLDKGATQWGPAFNTIKAKYGAPDDVIDNLLNKELWGETAAWEKRNAARKAGGQSFTINLP